jgi:hypothetical protein
LEKYTNLIGFIRKIFCFLILVTSDLKNIAHSRTCQRLPSAIAGSFLAAFTPVLLPGYVEPPSECHV